MSDGTPPQWEQDVAEAYVNERPLERPATSLKHALRFTIFLAVLAGLATSAVVRLVHHGPAASSIPRTIHAYAVDHPFAAIVVLYTAIVLLAVAACSRTIVIGMIQLYQHYAPEDIRRRCLFKPTCSQYAILAVRKYGVVVGLLRSYDRTFNRCVGRTYQIDWP